MVLEGARHLRSCVVPALRAIAAKKEGGIQDLHPNHSYRSASGIVLVSSNDVAPEFSVKYVLGSRHYIPSEVCIDPSDISVDLPLILAT